jgi:adenosylcobinamide-GDP ribazoletransferase
MTGASGAGPAAGGAAPAPPEAWRLEAGAILAAFAFLTRLPLPGLAHAPGTLERAVAWCPLVGVAVGAAAAAAYAGAGLLWPSPLPALAAVVTAVLLTGGFHEDGLADTADAFAAGGDRAHLRAVLADSRVGALGALALALVVAGKVVALAVLAPAAAGAALVAGHALGRWAIPALLWWLPYVSGEAGVAARLAAGATRRRLLVATVVAVAATAAASAVGVAETAAIAAAPPLAWTRLVVVLLAAAALVTAGLGSLYRRRLGGVTGDLLGAACQLVELASYLAVAALVGR